jgi:transposase-like protein
MTPDQTGRLSRRTLLGMALGGATSLDNHSQRLFCWVAAAGLVAVVLLTHFNFPAEHWIHLRTTNAVESTTFATVRLRTSKTKGAGSRSAGLAMAYKLLAAAQARWRCVNAPHLVALVRAGATFVDGIKVEREDTRHAA